jgi:hypothetical protein
MARERPQRETIERGEKGKGNERRIKSSDLKRVARLYLSENTYAC